MVDDPNSDWLSGGGDLGELIRAKDWSTTPLGPLNSWPPSLRMVVRLLLANRFPMLLWWGPELCQLYNEAYRPVLGTKHPESLGQPARECWPEIWDDIGPLIERPFSGGPATWMEDIHLEPNRHGYVEETHFTIAYSPVPDDTAPGGIGGVLATVHEISGKVVAERRVVALRDLAAQVNTAKTAEEACTIAASIIESYAKDIPFALIYLNDSDEMNAKLAGSAGVPIDSPVALPVLALSDDDDGTREWPIADVNASMTAMVVDDLELRFGRHIPPGPWSDPPRQAMVVPIRAPLAHKLAGFLIVGVSPRLALDDAYRSFFDLVAGQIATSVANARAYDEERRRSEALAELDRVKTAFFSNISHEFRTPLALMLGPLEEILAKSDLDDAAREQVHLAHRNSLRLLKLVNTLLDFSRIEAGRIQALYAPTDLAEFTAEIASVFRSAIERAGLLLVVDCPQLDEPVFVDWDMWEKIVLNLLSNAFKFTFEGEIRVDLRQIGNCVTLTVADTGIGISDEEIPHLFERFHRVKGARGRTFEGSGIGLALVQELARLNGGTVSVTSEIDRGSAFTVTVPLGTTHLPADRIATDTVYTIDNHRRQVEVEEALRWLATPGPDIGESGDSLRSDEVRSAGSTEVPRILLADDNADMRAYLQRLLSPRYEVVTVCDGQAALDAALATEFDLVLSDVMMPKLDGYGLLTALRANERTKTLPLILISARAGEEARVEGMQAGADDYLVKPFSARELVARVSAHIELARARNLADQKLRDSEQRFRQVAEASPFFIWVSRVDGVVEYANRRWADYSGMDATTTDPSVRITVVHPDDRPMITSAWIAAFKTAAPFELEARLRGVDGVYRWFLLRMAPLLDPDDNVERWFTVATDVDQRKQNENEARLLAELGEYYRSANDIDDLAFEVARATGTFINVDRVFFVEIDQRDDVGRVRRDYAREGPSVEGSYRVSEYSPNTLAEIASGRTVINCDSSTDPRTAAEYDAVYGPRAERAYVAVPLMRDGRWEGTFWVSASTPRRWHAREIALIEAIAERLWLAVEKLRLLEGERKARADAEDASRLKDEFLATISHELRAPLNSMLGWTRILRAGHLDARGSARALDTIERNAVSQVRLIEDILDVSRIVRGMLRLTVQQIEIGTIVTDAVETNRPAAEAKGIDLTVNLEVTGEKALVDPERLQQVIWNLVSNAVKFTDGGGSVNVRLSRADGRFLITVSDTGAGIDPSFLPHVFDRFRQGDGGTTRWYGGLGLGLAIVRHIVEMHGGTVAATSEGRGKGSVFTVALPMTSPKTDLRAVTASPSAAPKTDRPVDGDLTLDGKRLLVVDDDPDTRELMAYILARSGAEVRTAGSAEEALEILQSSDSWRPEAVLSDIGMPGADGYSLIKSIRAHGSDESRSVRAIALTGYARADDRARTLAAGFDSYLSKPVEPNALVEAVRRVIET